MDGLWSDIMRECLEGALGLVSGEFDPSFDEVETARALVEIALAIDNHRHCEKGDDHGPEECNTGEECDADGA